MLRPVTKPEFERLMPLFNREYVRESTLKQVLDNFQEAFPQTFDDLANPPKDHKGLLLCSRCSQVYWFTEENPANTITKGDRTSGNYCGGCRMKALTEELRL